MNLRKLDGRVPFFIVDRDRNPREISQKNGAVLHDWCGPDQYLEEAIKTGASDTVLRFLDSPSGREFATVQELHHQAHGATRFDECRDAECRQDFAAWWPLLVAGVGSGEGRTKQVNIADLVAKLDARLPYHVGHPEDECTETMKLADFKAVRAIVVAAKEDADADEPLKYFDGRFECAFCGAIRDRVTKGFKPAEHGADCVWANLLAAVRGEA